MAILYEDNCQRFYDILYESYLSLSIVIFYTIYMIYSLQSIFVSKRLHECRSDGQRQESRNLLDIHFLCLVHISIRRISHQFPIQDTSWESCVYSLENCFFLNNNFVRREEELYKSLHPSVLLWCVPCRRWIRIPAAFRSKSTAQWWERRGRRESYSVLPLLGPWHGHGFWLLPHLVL